MPILPLIGVSLFQVCRFSMNDAMEAIWISPPLTHFRFFLQLLGNAWWTVYEESKNSAVIPVAEAIPVSKDGTGKTELDLEKGELSDQPETVSSRHPHWCQTCNPIALLFGLAITIPVMAVVFALELVALLAFYLPSIFLYHSGQAFAPPNICTVVLYVTFMLLYWGFWFADYMVLLSSVLVTECLGMVALILGFVTGGCLWATQLHQHLRRVGHGIRVKFRKPNKPTKRKRRKKRRTSTSRTIMPPRGPSCFAPQRDYKSRRQEAMRVITVERERNASESLH